MSELTNITAGTDSTDVALPAVPTFDGKAYAVSVFEPFKKQITKAKREAAKVEAYDITTTAGMGRAKELRAMFRDIRTGVENVRKERKAPIIEAGKLLDARAAEIKAEVEPFEDKYDAEIKAEETRKEAEKQRKIELERARIEAIEGRIANIRAVPGRMVAADSQAIRKEIDQWTLLRLDPDDYQEHLEDALRAVNETIDQLGDLMQAAEAREAEQRRIAAEREELARLKAEQQKREQAEREAAAERERVAQVERLAAAEREAEQQRQLEQAKADQARQARVMEDIKAIQEIGLRDGDARALLDNLEYAKAIDITQDKFNAMMSMAQMAKDMAITSLQSKYQQRLAVELPAAHDEALAEDLAREQARDEQAYCNQRAEAEHGAFVEAEARQQPAEQVPDLIDPVAEYAAQPPLKHKAPRPTDEEIVASAVAWYGESQATIAEWLLGMDQAWLLSLTMGAGK
jgi:hypothetical protein